MGLPALHQLLPRTFGQLPRRDDPPALRRRGLFLPRAVLLRKGAQIRRHPLLRLRDSVERLGFAQTAARQPRIRDEEGHGGPRPRHHGPARQLAERRALPPEQKRRPRHEGPRRALRRHLPQIPRHRRRDDRRGDHLGRLFPPTGRRRRMGRHGAEQIFALQRQYAQTRRPLPRIFHPRRRRRQGDDPLDALQRRHPRTPRHPIHVPQHAPQRHAAAGEPLPDGRRLEDSGPARIRDHDLQPAVPEPRPAHGADAHGSGICRSERHRRGDRGLQELRHDGLPLHQVRERRHA